MALTDGWCAGPPTGCHDNTRLRTGAGPPVCQAAGSGGEISLGAPVVTITWFCFLDMARVSPAFHSWTVQHSLLNSIRSGTRHSIAFISIVIN